MSTAALTHDRTAIPTEIESTGSKLVYLYLHTAGEATIEDLQSSLDMKQLALFPVLDTLSSEGLVTRTGETYTVAA
ncbi:MAG: TrmB family transcriptional regulator [Euryarchaeota archaeon]|nr:TrmB family transcriptional regulator [Euryarchaeota archaeon]